MNMLKKSARAFLEQQRVYFSEARDDIAVTNVWLLCLVSAITFCFTVLFVLITPFIIPGWSVTVHYIIILIAGGVLAVISQIMRMIKFSNGNVIRMVCCIALAVLAVCLVCIDVLPYPEQVASFTPLLFCILPALFILKLKDMVILMSGIEVLFIIMVNEFKPVEVGSFDIFSSIVGFCFGMAIAFVIVKLRLNDSTVRFNYKYLSQIDGLTGILNKKMVIEEMQSYMESRTENLDVALLIIDVDNFKHVNDTFGHDKGDEILVSVSRSLSRCVRSTDIFGRFGGDEFIIMMKSIPEPDVVNKKCTQVMDEFALMKLEGFNEKFTCSIGVSHCSNRTVSFNQLFRDADAALYEVKNSGKNRYNIHRL